MESSKDIVTGGCGFIGSHLVDALLAEGRKVHVIDNCSVGRQSNLSDQATNSNLEINVADITDREAMRELIAGADRVFHLAAMADIVPSINNPSLYFDTNVNGTFSIVEAAQKANVRKFIYAASSSCYGIPESYPTSELSPMAPQYPYALTKMLGEQIVLHWAEVFQLPAVSLRMFNVYGTRARTSGTYGAVFGVFLAQKLAKKPLTVIGDGEQTRDFTYVSDAVDAVKKAADSNLVNEVMNIGSGNTYSINRLVDLLECEVVHIPKRPGEPERTFADISKITRMLDWQPKVSLEEGVDLMLKNIDYWKDAPVWNPKTIEEETRVWFEKLS